MEIKMAFTRYIERIRFKNTKKKKNEFSIYDFKFFLYIDNKVHDIAQQFSSFFSSGFLPASETIIIYRHYNNAYKIESAATNLNVKTYPFFHYSEIPNLKEGFCFYTHNALSNIRLVNNRNLRHILLLHGESEKKASYKAISRVYDYLVVSGQRAIDRYIEYGIFSKYERNKFIKMGNVTLNLSIPPLVKNPLTESCIVYTPTWEGGIDSENYTSLKKSRKVFEILKTLSKKENIKKIIIKPHPNTGIRKKETLLQLTELINNLKKDGFSIKILSNEKAWINRKIKPLKTCPPEELANENISLAVCDISSMILQFMYSGVKVITLKDSTEHFQLPSPWINIDSTLSEDDVVKLQDKEIEENTLSYFIGYENNEVEQLSQNDKFNWLISNIKEKEKRRDAK
jgi:hypothetical protein